MWSFATSQNTNAVHHYYNSAKTTPNLFDSANPILGISNSALSVDNNNLICSFRRDNSNSNSKYYDVSAKNPRIIVAYGSINSDGSK